LGMSKLKLPRIKNRYVWACAYYYLTELIEYEFDEARAMLGVMEVWQIEELAYKGRARRKHNLHWFNGLMQASDRK